MLDDSLPPGYYRGSKHGELLTLPWPVDDRDVDYLLEHSLGPLVLDWAEWRTGEPGLVNDAGEPWQFTDGQARFLILWYAFDERGRFIYRRGLRRGAKGTGKDPFGAALCNIELVGPSQIYWDDERGCWWGKRHTMPLVQIASNSEDQSKDVLRVANSQWNEEAADYYRIDKGLTATTIKGTAARLEVLTASVKSSEGDPATFILLNETHHMTESSGGMEVAKVARRNVGKSKREFQARICEMTNAHLKGGGSAAEKTHDAWQKQLGDKRLKQDILYDSVEYDPRLDIYSPDDRELAVRQAYSDAPWADIERLCDEIVDPELSAGDAIRFYLNGLGVAEDAYIDPQMFAALADTSKPLVEGDRIAMFLDCSKSEDATALMFCRIEDGYSGLLGVWERPRGARGQGFLVDRNEVDRAVMEAKQKYKVVWFGVDPSPAKDDTTEASYWKPFIDKWHREFARSVRLWACPQNSVLFDMRASTIGGAKRNQLFSEETEILQDLIDSQGLNGTFRHDGNPILTLHMNNCRGRYSKWGLIVGKANRSSNSLVDAAVAMIGANVGRRLALNSGKVRIKKTGSGKGPRFVAMA